MKKELIESLIARILQDSIRFYKSTKDKRKDKAKEKYAWDSLLYVNI